MRLFFPGTRYVDEFGILSDCLLTCSGIDIIVSIPSTDIAVSVYEPDERGVDTYFGDHHHINTGAQRNRLVVICKKAYSSSQAGTSFVTRKLHRKY